MSAESAFDALSGIKRLKPVRLTCSHKAWPLMIVNLAVPGVGSTPTGRRALLLAMTYRSTPWAGTAHALSQPQYDVQLMKDYLLETGAWSESDITVLTDAKGTPENRLPTYANIMRELKLLGESKCQNIFFLYTGHSDQRRQPKQPILSRPAPKNAPGRRVVEEFDQFIIPIDAVIGPELADINQEVVIIDDVLHERLISTLPPRSTFLAILDTCHSATLFDLEHDRCNRTGSVKSLLRRSVRKVIVEPLWKVFGKATGGLDNVDSFNISHFCNGLCPRQKSLICPIAIQVTISACKDQQQVYENGPSLTRTIVELLRSNPSACLRDVVDSVLNNYKLQQQTMKSTEKMYKRQGNETMRRELSEMRLKASRLKPQVASTTALLVGFCDAK
ncbi:hypothetical protein BKA70DRAFT_1427060 [Coprinopsis sp. MPI-PUGE-AT-0042]|nr:hypothetical protein BKA70DRAFT_1427060 [Coprinopsis sp. MPI-PUGE-AT-0042]